MMSAIESPTMFNSSQAAQQSAAPRTWNVHMAAVVAKLREFAPYAVMLALPGGSLLALGLWLCRRQRNAW
jgi:hypothetical protein